MKSLSKKNVEKILIVCLDNLGDAVMATALIAPLKTLFPTAKLGFWVKSYSADAFKAEPDIRWVFGSDPFWDRSPGRGKGSFRQFMSTAMEVRRCQFDVALILNTEWRRSLFSFFAGIPCRVGFPRRKSSPFITHIVHGKNIENHIVERYGELLKVFTDEKLPMVPSLLSKDQIDLQEIETLNLKGHRVIAIHPFSGDLRKNWPIENWLVLIKNLVSIRSDLFFVILCSPSEGPLCQPFHLTFDKKNLCVQSQLGLDQVKSILAFADLFVGGDSGLGHLAAALKTPVVSLFGDHTRPEMCSPRGETIVNVIQKSPISSIEPSCVAEMIISML